MLTITGKFTTATVTIDDIDDGTLNQIQEMCDHPSAQHPIAIMPDTHLGKGCVIGFTMPIGDKIVPNYVGVDVGCGMQSVKYDILAEDFFKDDYDKEAFDEAVRQSVPMGFNVHEETAKSLKEEHFYTELRINHTQFHVAYVNRYGAENSKTLKYINDLADFEQYITKFSGKTSRVLNSLGTLGGGNHFIECSEGNDDKLWITVHTGSRNFGKQVCDYHQDKAWKLIEDKKIRGKQEFIESLHEQVETGEIAKRDISNEITAYDKEHQVVGISKQDAFLEGIDMYEYFYDMVVAQTYAKWNRISIHSTIKTFVYAKELERIESIHNYISFKDFIIRKGAISSYIDEKMIVPFNSRDGILICEGKSNADWNYSAPHGAGRIMSRSAANKQITPEKAKDVMSTVFATETPVDESPLCYKDAWMIEQAIEPTANIVDRLKPIVNFKAN